MYYVGPTVRDECTAIARPPVASSGLGILRKKQENEIDKKLINFLTPDDAMR